MATKKQLLQLLMEFHSYLYQKGIIDDTEWKHDRQSVKFLKWASKQEELKYLFPEKKPHSDFLYPFVSGNIFKAEKTSEWVYPIPRYMLTKNTEWKSLAFPTKSKSYIVLTEGEVCVDLGNIFKLTYIGEKESIYTDEVSVPGQSIEISFKLPSKKIVIKDSLGNKFKLKYVHELQNIYRRVYNCELYKGQLFGENANKKWKDLNEVNSKAIIHCVDNGCPICDSNTEVLRCGPGQILPPAKKEKKKH